MQLGIRNFVTSSNVAKSIYNVFVDFSTTLEMTRKFHRITYINLAFLFQPSDNEWRNLVRLWDSKLISEK